MLFLVGLGLDFKDLSVRSLEAVKKSPVLLIEEYTSFLPKGYVEYVEGQAGRKARLLSRSDMEENVNETVSEAKEKDVALLVPGDPLVATTHHIILNAARKLGIKVEILHSASAFTAAIGESGLDIYKFGLTATIAFWFEKYRPVSFLDTVKKNLENGEHTMLLLDIDQKNHRPMSVLEAVELLKKAEAERKYGIVKDGLKLIIMANAGRADGEIAYVEIGKITERVAAGLSGKAICLILPSKMSFAEEENLSYAVSDARHAS